MGEKEAVLKKAPDNILIALKEAQDKFGYLSPERLAEIAASFDVPGSDVFGIASFYSFLLTRPAGRNIIRICKGLPCDMKNGRAVIDAVQRVTGIKPGQTTPDGRFSFELTNCIGLCDQAPAMLVNNDAHVNLTPETISQILQQYK